MLRIVSSSLVNAGCATPVPGQVQLAEPAVPNSTLHINNKAMNTIATPPPLCILKNSRSAETLIEMRFYSMF